MPTSDQKLLAILDRKWSRPMRNGKRDIMLDGRSVGDMMISGSGHGVVSITTFSIRHELQQQGLGRRVMARLGAWADETGCDIALEAFWRPGTPDGGHLIRFYSDQGFEIDCGPGPDHLAQMVRNHRAVVAQSHGKEDRAMKRGAELFQYDFSWGPKGSSRSEEADYIALFAVIPGRAAGRVSPAEPDSIEIAQILNSDGGVPASVADRIHAEIADWLIETRAAEMLSCANEAVRDALEDQEPAL